MLPNLSNFTRGFRGSEGLSGADIGPWGEGKKPRAGIIAGRYMAVQAPHLCWALSLRHSRAKLSVAAGRRWKNCDIV